MLTLIICFCCCSYSAVFVSGGFSVGARCAPFVLLQISVFTADSGTARKMGDGDLEKVLTIAARTQKPGLQIISVNNRFPTCCCLSSYFFKQMSPGTIKAEKQWCSDKAGSRSSSRYCRRAFAAAAKTKPSLNPYVSLYSMSLTELRLDTDKLDHIKLKKPSIK